jgi:hypothetical protein
VSNAAEEPWRDALRRYYAAGQTISGQPDPAWEAAPYELLGLAPESGAWDAELRAGGLLAASLGPRIDVRPAGRRYRHRGGSIDLAECVRAWPVLPLEGATFEVADVTGIAPALRALLRERLPGLDWWVPEHWGGPFLKYGLLHNCFAAPPNEMTGERMSLEIHGFAARAALPGSPQWAHLMQEWLDQGGNPLEGPDRVRFPTLVCIEGATYANICSLGHKVPDYL